jgi:hypothetical protein
MYSEFFHVGAYGFYKSHRSIAEKASNHFKKSSMCTYLKSLAVLKKASISLKKSAK